VAPLRRTGTARAPVLGAATLVAAVTVSASLIGTYLALGGASYKPVAVADPCKPRPIEKPQGGGEVLQQLALSALDGAACSLHVTREDLALALADRNARDRFLREHRVSNEALEQALRAGLLRAVNDGRRVDALSGLEASILRAAIDQLPIGVVIDVLQRSPRPGRRRRMISGGRRPGPSGNPEHRVRCVIQRRDLLHLRAAVVADENAPQRAGVLRVHAQP
jgi:hypothetical protein